jgi:hypothetical protein
VMEFETSNYNETTVLLTHYEKKFGVWEGKAFFNKDSTLVITVTKESNQSAYMHYLFPLSNQVDHYDMCIGETTIKNGVLENAVTKIVLLEKCPDLSSAKAKRFQLNDKELPKSICGFLRLKEFQPLLSPPASAISDQDTLKNWVERRQANPQK